MISSFEVSKEAKKLRKEYLMTRITINHSIIDPKKKLILERYHLLR